VGPLEVLGRQLADLAADRGGAGERDDPHPRVVLDDAVGCELVSGDGWGSTCFKLLTYVLVVVRKSVTEKPRPPDYSQQED
jgi:hypothetical protein